MDVPTFAKYEVAVYEMPTFAVAHEVGLLLDILSWN